jgi:hypothetical protein
MLQCNVVGIQIVQYKNKTVDFAVNWMYNMNMVREKHHATSGKLNFNNRGN